ncbi:LysR substrate-binding domain-containing protein [Bradyrhizobium japonicum]
MVEALRREAPGIDLVVRPIIDPAASVASLEHGDVDALMGGHLPASPRIIRSTLFTERFVCIRDAKRAKLKARLTKDDYTRLPHVLFSSAGGDGLPGAIDTMLSRHGRKRRTAITLAHVVAVPFAVAGTDLVATMAERVARRFATAAGVSVVPNSLRCGGVPHRPSPHAPRHGRSGVALVHRTGQSRLREAVAIGGPAPAAISAQSAARSPRHGLRGRQRTQFVAPTDGRSGH